MKCEIHGIAAGPDGHCALCRSARRREEKRAGARLGWILFLGLGTATGALLGWHSLRSRPTRAGPDAQLETTVLGAGPAAAAKAVVPEVPAGPPPAAAPPGFAASNAAAPAVSATTGEAPPALPSGDAMQAQPSAAPPPAPTSSVDQKPPPSPEQIRATLLATPIVMYSAAWCGVCRRAKAFLQENGLRYAERDIDADPATLAELRLRTGRAAVPVLEIDGTLMQSGFSERSVERALVASVERRLGVKGIRLETH